MKFLLGTLLLCTACAMAGSPPADVRLEPLTTASGSTDHPLGKLALSTAPEKWKHAQTPHFIFHYRRVTEAQRAAREIEFTLWYVAQSLGAAPERYAKKSHVYVFQDAREWTQFRHDAGMPKWTASFASGDDLFLHIGGPGEEFDSRILAHETVHAVIARLYPGKRWPLWLNEGFADHMAGVSMAARKRVWAKGLERELKNAKITLNELVGLTHYPAGTEESTAFYQSSEKLVRFLLTAYPKEHFPKFVETMLTDKPFREAVVEVYSEQAKDYAAFLKKYEQFK